MPGLGKSGTSRMSARRSSAVSFRSRPCVGRTGGLRSSAGADRLRAGAPDPDALTREDRTAATAGPVYRAPCRSGTAHGGGFRHTRTWTGVSRDSDRLGPESDPNPGSRPELDDDVTLPWA